MVVQCCANTIKGYKFWKEFVMEMFIHCTCLISTLGLNTVEIFVMFIKLDFILAWMLSCS